MVNHVKTLAGIEEGEECAAVVFTLFGDCLSDEDSCIAWGGTFWEAKLVSTLTCTEMFLGAAGHPLLNNFAQE